MPEKKLADSSLILRPLAAPQRVSLVNYPPATNCGGLLENNTMSTNFITSALDKLNACRFALAIRQAPLDERDEHKQEIDSKWLAFIACYTFDLTEAELKEEMERLQDLLLAKCDDVDLSQIKHLLK